MITYRPLARPGRWVIICDGKPLGYVRRNAEGFWPITRRDDRVESSYGAFTSLRSAARWITDGVDGENCFYGSHMRDLGQYYKGGALVLAARRI